MDNVTAVAVFFVIVMAVAAAVALVALGWLGRILVQQRRTPQRTLVAVDTSGAFAAQRKPGARRVQPAVHRTPASRS